jgi:hypothetical protein
MEERENVEVQLDENGFMNLRVTRSWSGMPYLEIRATEKAIESIVYESIYDGDQEITLDEAKQKAIYVARCLLDCEIEAVPKEERMSFETEDLSDLNLIREAEDYEHDDASKHNHYDPTDYSKYAVNNQPKYLEYDDYHPNKLNEHIDNEAKA